MGSHTQDADGRSHVNQRAQRSPMASVLDIFVSLRDFVHVKCFLYFVLVLVSCNKPTSEHLTEPPN